ncbi:MAG: hypothetical protein ACRYF9_26325 [Janthinobacterium lividum]|uniref:hypothetical protein n=1 Tax=Pseudomonas TaxID=286 RepID=UPI001CFA308B|nr:MULTISPECIES: hypothetical protein [Pseudomonas]
MTEKVDIRPSMGADMIDLIHHSPEHVVRFHEGHRLRFAKQILLFLFVLCMIVIIGYGLEPANEAWENMFELVKIGALPLVTLVIGFYFPSSVSGK